ncbi:hypothetical protein PY650_33725 [Rhizobium calliandrae]|uniref:Copper chaperone PCu(A)C n=1 Tax=Rhizobium calliandrae TaxID=1312182 RepID=A0ABT7KPA2_9HYPH|nr:hypothetical protein [Rhizobium calliandrae]MDL2410455.1 hypothetical protein [Rhizobium calliandrae]
MVVVADAIFCDDIRQEVTGKFILIGVYPGDLVPGRIPSSVPMGAMVRVHGLQKGVHEVEMVLTSPNGQRVIEEKSTFDLIESHTPMVLIFAGFVMPIDGPGEITLSMKIAGEEPIASKLPVVLSKTTEIAPS